jgi:hypothetical protein
MPAPTLSAGGVACGIEVVAQNGSTNRDGERHGARLIETDRGAKFMHGDAGASCDLVKQAPCSAGEADSRAALAHAYVVGDKFAAKIIEGVFFSVVFPHLFEVVHLFLAITPPASIAP